jgi:pyruvate kinase
MTDFSSTQMRRAKIVATLGPASSTEETIRSLVDSGVDVFRLNFSHGTHDDHRASVDIIRKIEHDRGHPIGILMDLQGPKLRVGTFDDGEITLRDGEGFNLYLNEHKGDANGVMLPHAEIFEAMKPGMDLLLNDGRLRLRVDAVTSAAAETTVITGGPLSDRKGVNVPGVLLPMSALTQKDRQDMEFGLSLGADWCALSFVQSPEDVKEARHLIGDRAAIMVKLEKPAALEFLEEIVQLSDAVMVARGDLGVEMEAERVPSAQRKIVNICREKGKPVVIATQMLESMTTSPTPTRAEASDVATAVYAGVDAVMLSAETASGDHPIEAVRVMDRIIRYTETDEHYQRIRDLEEAPSEESDNDAIAAAACHVAHSRKCAAVATFTTTGSTTRRAARLRMPVPLLGLTPLLETARRLQLVWGVRAVNTRDVSSFPEMVGKSTRIARREGFADDNDRIVVTAGVPFGTPGATNILRLARVGEFDKND